jgi:hypothetical protein
VAQESGTARDGEGVEKWVYKEVPGGTEKRGAAECGWNAWEYQMRLRSARAPGKWSPIEWGFGTGFLRGIELQDRGIIRLNI